MGAVQVADRIASDTDQPRKWGTRDVVEPSPRHKEGLRNDLLSVGRRDPPLGVAKYLIGVRPVQGLDFLLRVGFQGRLLRRPTTPYVLHTRSRFRGRSHNPGPCGGSRVTLLTPGKLGALPKPGSEARRCAGVV